MWLSYKAKTYQVIEERNAPTQTHYIEKQCFA